MTSSRLTFTILPSPASSIARRATLQVPSRNALQTPHYIAISSRGVLPHLTADMTKHTDVKGVYYALEDFMGKDSMPPIIQLAEHDTAALHHFTALPDAQFTVLGPRRIPPLTCPSSSSDTAIPISTSTGFTMLKHSVYITHAQALSPDIVVGLADLPSGTTASTRRMQNMTARTEDWMQQMATANNDGHCLNLFASILPVELEAQRLYLEMLQNELSDSIDGLAFYSSASAAVIPAGLAHLPRLSMSSLMTPQQILREVMLGVDLFAVEFVNASTDAGVALKFEFPAPTDTYTRTTEHSHLHRKEMGIDVWSDEHATDLSPLTADCDCYTCEKHHRAYIHHLLVAKEMLAWTLLQVHNYTMINRFFTGIRRSIKKGEFERDVGLFEDIYEAAMPKGGGKGPRTRGYQRASSGPNEAKANPVAYRSLKTAPAPDR